MPQRVAAQMITNPTSVARALVAKPSTCFPWRLTAMLERIAEDLLTAGRMLDAGRYNFSPIRREKIKQFDNRLCSLLFLKPHIVYSEKTKLVKSLW